MQSDSSQALSILSSTSVDRSAYGHLSLEIKVLMADMEFILQKIHRDQNRVADCSARYSRTECTTYVWLLRGPSCTKDLLPHDCNSIILE